MNSLLIFLAPWRAEDADEKNFSTSLFPVSGTQANDYVAVDRFPASTGGFPPLVVFDAHCQEMLAFLAGELLTSMVQRTIYNSQISRNLGLRLFAGLYKLYSMRRGSAIPHAGTPSRILRGVPVGMTLVRVNPAFSNN
jgi:hypothetical protein